MLSGRHSSKTVENKAGINEEYSLPIRYLILLISM
jgi:hypothetical protein